MQNRAQTVRVPTRIVLAALSRLASKRANPEVAKSLKQVMETVTGGLQKHVLSDEMRLTRGELLAITTAPETFDNTGGDGNGKAAALVLSFFHPRLVDPCGSIGIPIGTLIGEVFPTLLGLDTEGIAATIGAVVPSDGCTNIHLNPKQVLTLGIALDPSRSKERLERLRVETAGKLYSYTKKQRRRVVIPCDLLEIAKALLPKGSPRWLSGKLASAKTAISLKRQQIYQITDRLDPRGVRRRKELWRECFNHHE